MLYVAAAADAFPRAALGKYNEIIQEGRRKTFVGITPPSFRMSWIKLAEQEIEINSTGVLFTQNMLITL
jgi:hypothetical protein